MKELTGQIKEWDGQLGRGTIKGGNGSKYRFTKKEWAEPDFTPEVDGGVLVICQNGRDVSKVEYLYFEHIPAVTTRIYSPEGHLLHSESRRFIGGPRRMRSDALAWMQAAKSLHAQVSSQPILDISSLLLSEHLPICIRGSVIKYCYGFAIELYLKWILTEGGIKYKKNHRLSYLKRKIPTSVLRELRENYSKRCNTHLNEFQDDVCEYTRNN